MADALDSGGGGGSTVAGIELPPGEPGAVREAAQGLRGAGSGFSRVGTTAAAAASSVSWQGVAASAFIAQTGDYSDAAGRADAACVQAGGVLARFAERLEDGRERVRRLQEQAEQAMERMTTATAAADAAGERASAARGRAFDATIGAPLDGGTFSVGEGLRALEEAGDEADEQAKQAGIAQQAQQELEELRQRAKEEREAVKEAATAAAGELGGAQDGLPVVAGGAMLGRSGAVEDRVLAGVRAGDYSVLEGVPLNSLDEGTQRAIGAEFATDAHEAAGAEDDGSLQEMAGYVGRYETDGDFAVGFYNQLGGVGANALAQGITRTPVDGGYDEWLAMAAPFATLLGTATRSPGLTRGFAGGFVRSDLSREDEDRWQSYSDLEIFVTAGEASNYDSQFLSDFGEEVMFAETGAPINGLQYHQRLIEFTAGNPEASALLLTGTAASEARGVGDEYPNAHALLGQPFWDDDGAALGALVNAGTHELREDGLYALDPTQVALSSDASHSVIVAAGMTGDDLVPGVKQPLVTILDDRIEDFEYVATERALPGNVAAPDFAMEGFTYEQGHDYLKALYGDDATREATSGVLGERVGNDMYQAAANDDLDYALRAGSLSEMGVLAAGDADLDQAQSEDASAEFANKAGGAIIGLTPPGKVPVVSGLVSGEALGALFPADAVEQHLEQQTAAQVNAFGEVRRTSIELQVALGQLPPEASEIINPDGSVNPNFVEGPNYNDDVVRVDSDGDGQPDRALRWDLDDDGKISADEEQVTESELFAESQGIPDLASHGLSELYEVERQGANPPDIDDLPLPEGYDNNNPSTFEEVWEWPFDAEGEGTIADSSGNEVGNQDDMQWDPGERVYRLPIEHEDGSSGEIVFFEFDEGGWQPAEKVDGEWQPTG